MKRTIATAVTLAALVPVGAGAYPLDGYEETGINRLQAYYLAREGLRERGTLPPGAFRTLDEVRLRLRGQPDLALPAPDPEFTAEVRAFLGDDVSRYGVSVLDLSDLKHPRYAEVNGTKIQTPGSVGKIAVALAWFQALADLFPDDIEARRRILYDTVVTANGFIRTDHHETPFWAPGEPRVVWRPIEEGDRASLWTYLDWMCSASSNAAASMLMSHLLLLKHFGDDYPVSEEEAATFFEKTPKTELQALFTDAIVKPLSRNGIDPEQLRQGSFFTREGKRRVPGTGSASTSRELLRYLLLLEQGRLVDPWSSLEIKRLLYLTDTRIRYAAHPVLNGSAVYFKSGSLYSCRPEPGFECKKYHGNVKNYLNSVAIIESEEDGRSLHYLVTLLSNVLRKNSSVEHQTFAMRIHRLIEASRPIGAPSPGQPPEADLPDQ